MSGSDSLAALSTRIGHIFRDPRLLALAVTHRSYGPVHNERLEFLGDSVLGLSISTLLYAKGIPDEGRLSYWRSSLVRASTLADVARTIHVGSCLLMGDREAASGGADRESILADMVEALIGAVYLDGGFEAAHAVVSRLFRDRISQVDPEISVKDAKTRLQEWLQGRRLPLPTYTVVESHGAIGSMRFRVRCAASGHQSDGIGPTRRAAEQDAAAKIIASVAPGC
jgi:ribonuclease-3